MKRVLVTIVLFVLFLAQTLWAEVPLVLNHQGRLLDGNDTPVSGTVQLTFSVYTLETGSAVLLYTETQSGITVTDGLFNVMIGDVTPLPDSISNHSPLELGISVNAEAELLPRLRIGTVPYALRASGVSGHIETGPGSLRVPNIGSSGQDGVSITGTQEETRLSLENIGSSGQDGVALVATDDSSRLSIGNIGSSGEDGVSITAFNVTKRNAITATQQNEAARHSAQMIVDSATGASITLADSGFSGIKTIYETAVANNSGRFALGDINRDGRADIRASQDSSRLSLENIGSSGQDGVNIVTNDSGTALKLYSVTGQPTPVGEATNSTYRGAQLTVHNIGSSGQDGVDIVANDSGASIFVIGNDAPIIEMSTVGGPGRFLIRGDQSVSVKVVDITGDSTGALVKIRDTDGTPDDGVVIMATNSSGAKVGIGTETPSEALHVVGNICATGTIGACSDARFKEHVETIGDAMAVIEKLRGVDFDWKRSEFADHQFADGKQLGFVAQEVKDVLPMLVSQGSDGYLSVDYGRLTPVLVEAVKAQQKIIDNQNGELSAVKAQLEKLQKLVSKLLEETNSSTVR